MINQTFKNIEEFYKDNPKRATSPESDYGVHWTELGKNFPRWRVSYVKDTGEIYAMEQQGVDGKVVILGIVPHDNGAIYYKTLDGILAGWAEMCGKPDSLGWVRDRLTAQRTAENMEDFRKHQSSGAEGGW